MFAGFILSLYTRAEYQSVLSTFKASTVFIYFLHPDLEKKTNTLSEPLASVILRFNAAGQRSASATSTSCSVSGALKWSTVLDRVGILHG